MKTILLIGAMGALVAMPQTAHALTGLVQCLGTVCNTGSIITNGNFAPANCASVSDNCYDNTRIYTCNTCNSGYTRTKQTITVSGCFNTIAYYNCVKESDDGGTDCDGTCEDCESTDWNTLSDGYQSRTTKTCNTRTCVCSSDISHRCATGYYGTAKMTSCQAGTNGWTCNTTDCQRCPAATGIYTNSARTVQAYGTVLAGNGNEKTDCYLPAGTYYDATGSFEKTGSDTLILSRCAYTE